jgi:hypothetical protein
MTKVGIIASNQFNFNNLHGDASLEMLRFVLPRDYCAKMQFFRVGFRANMELARVRLI